MPVAIIHDTALAALSKIPSASIDLVYIDPPYNTGLTQTGSAGSYEDKFEDFELFLTPVLRQIARVIKPNGSIFLHLDYREIHYVAVWMDKIMGRKAFQGEIIWHFETGGLSRSSWSNKHSTMLQYCYGKPVFNFAAVPETERKAPKPGYEGGKKWTSVWNVNMSTTDGQRTGYPTQKPEALLAPLIEVHTQPGDLCLDAFSGSGTLGAVANKLGRHAICIDANPDAVATAYYRIGENAKMYGNIDDYLRGEAWDPTA